ncbi:MAG: YggS family pyridoxal phosphate-dependent enzyme [Eubacteriales bacterium]|nr:YggS family pyridoxal phosphate-dependent enzyme [Clostridia bacterium]MDY2844652.1 YggS family pyridoxal phosphate-dependent enzyme [Eubacteriales bacterium]
MTEERKKELSENYARVLEMIEAAKKTRGGDKPVTLLAATKTVPAEDICYLIENCGLKLCGENHAQEFTDKYDAVRAAGAEMDFIGHLQTNKVKYIVGKARLIHSLDSIKLAEEINSRAEKLGVEQKVLVEVNIGEEENKTGVNPGEVGEFLKELETYPAIKVCGMMTMAPKCEEINEFRKYFKESYRIFLDFFAKKTHNIGEPVLSMGMSDSFECAIEEGADIVRLGSIIFGKRKYK